MNCSKGEDKLLSELIAIYEARGYRRYKPGCFEDYSLYLENIDFLISKNVITFSGAEGRVLALRPDVTLSVISHAEAGDDTHKLFYTEKVYRRPDGSGEFREINQAGVEVIGSIDGACQAEVASLVAETLLAISPDYLIDISHMGYTEGLFSSFGLSEECREEFYGYLRGKNVHDFASFASSRGLDEEAVNRFAAAVNLGGDALKAVERAKKIAVNDVMAGAADELCGLAKVLCGLGYGKKFNLNFSIANNADYYNGVIFNGYVGGVPKRVLSGGRYDKLLKKMGKSGGAIGFALYLGELERYFRPEGNFVDCLILYDDDAQYDALYKSSQMAAEGRSSAIYRSIPDGLQYGEILDMRGKKR